MSVPFEDIKETLSGLPVTERAELAHFLLHTLDPAGDDATADWLAVAEQRMVDVKAGRIVGIPAEQAIESLRRPRV